MNKLVCGILTVILCLSAVGALAQESDLPEVRWTYPVSLTEIQSKYAMLVNADNMLDEDFEPDPLVKVTDVKRATSAAVSYTHLDVYKRQDPLFRYHTGKTFAEMTEKEKNAVSHRAAAAAKMRGVLMEAL